MVMNMTNARLIVNSWGGNPINDGTIYVTKYSANDRSSGSNPPATAVLSTVPGQYPVAVRGQVRDRVIALSITVRPPMAQANLETLKSWFDPLLGFQTLVATDSNGDQRQIDAFPESFQPVNALGYSYMVILRAPGAWHATNPTATFNDQIASGQTHVVTNAGNTRAYPSITLTPNSLKTHANSYLRRRRLIIASRADLPISDPVGDGWPVDVVGGILDTATPNGASQLLASMDDLRLVLSGREINRWLYPASVNANTAVWANLQFRAKKTATITSAAASSSVPASGSDLAVSNPGGLAGWPSHGFFLWGTECIHYADRTDATFINITRGSRNTTAASHAALLTVYWVEHPFLDLIYDYTAAVNPPIDPDKEPLINRAGSSNAHFLWSNDFFNNDATDLTLNRRSAAWQRVYVDVRGFNGQYSAMSDTGAAAYVQDIVPTNAAPNYNGMVMDFPYGLLTGSAITSTTVIDTLWRVLVHATDAGGNEALLLDAPPGTTALSATITSDAYRARFTARCGVLTGELTPSSDVAASATLITADVYSSFSFICDSQEANVQGFFVRARNNGAGTAHLFCAIYSDQGGVPSEQMGIYVNQALTGSFLDYAILGSLYKGTLGRLEAGRRYHVVLQQGAGTGAVEFCFTPRTKARHYYVLSNDIILANQPSCAVLVDGLTDTQEDAPHTTAHHVSFDEILCSFNTTRSPLILIGAAETFYLVQARIKNVTTGDYLDIYHPMTLGQTIVIDCENRRLLDSETGEDIAFAITPSNAAEWLFLIPGGNTIEYTEVGVVNTTLSSTFFGGYL